MRVDLHFGRSGLTVDLPAGPEYRVLEARWAQAVEDPDMAIGAALESPIGCPPLTDLARGRGTAAISVCDITRPAPNRVTLPHVLRRLELGGIPAASTRIFIATGLHREATEEELVEILGEQIVASYEVVNHDARDLAAHADLGRSSTGTPIQIDRRWVESGIRITLGFIEQHLMAGFSGSRKLIVPGLASQETIKTIHSPRFMREKKAVEGSIEENPLHQELVEIALRAGHDFSLDVVLAEGRRIAGVFAGDPRQAHLAGIGFVRDRTTGWIPRQASAAITTAAGYPLDLTFYQAVKGVTAASHIVKPGGIILVMAACDEGAGSPEFSRLLKESPAPAEFLASIEKTPVGIDQWQLEQLALVMQTHQVWFYVPGVMREYGSCLWGSCFESAAEAVHALAQALPAGAEVAVIPEGPYVFARPEAGAPEPALV
jgi:nickel-dependent lactate racemase